MSTYIARITRQSGDKVVKDEIKMEDLDDLFTSLAEVYEEIYDWDVLEIHIFREVTPNG